MSTKDMIPSKYEDSAAGAVGGAAGGVAGAGEVAASVGAVAGAGEVAASVGAVAETDAPQGITLEELLEQQQAFLDAGFTSELKFREGCLTLLKNSLEAWKKENHSPEVVSICDETLNQIKANIKTLRKNYWINIFHRLLPWLIHNKKQEKDTTPEYPVSTPNHSQLQPQIIKLGEETTQMGEETTQIVTRSFHAIIHAIYTGHTAILIIPENKKEIAHLDELCKIIDDNFTSDFIATL